MIKKLKSEINEGEEIVKIFEDGLDNTKLYEINGVKGEDKI